MSWQIGYDSNWNRFIGYGVPAYCDHPGCTKEIDRGLSYVCGGEPYGGEVGCGLFFCSEHKDIYNKRISGHIDCVELCYRCGHGRKPYKQKQEHPLWIKHMLSDESWSEWRKENPTEVQKMKLLLKEIVK